MTLKVRADDLARDDDYIRSLHRARDARRGLALWGFPDRGGIERGASERR